MAIRIFLLGLILVGCTQRALVAGTLGTPNIIFVLFDDIGYGQPTSYRAESPFRTPNINRLAQEGMLFTDAHAAAANCTPTRYGVLTGRYPCRIGQFGVLKTYSPPIIPADRPTVASFLQQQGYHTACIGKWHLGMNWIDGKPGTEKKLHEPSRPASQLLSHRKKKLREEDIFLLHRLPGDGWCVVQKEWRRCGLKA